MRLPASIMPYGADHRNTPLAVLWSSWAVYSWLTNAVPAVEVIPAGIVIFCSMAAMFVASLAVPGAFGDYGVLFACLLGGATLAGAPVRAGNRGHA